MNDKQSITDIAKDHFTNDFSREVYNTKYRYGNEDLDATLWRVAKTVASAEKEPEKWAPVFREMLENFKFIPGGRIMSNAGIPLKGTTFFNCFVSGFRGYDQDSMDSILDELRRQAMILKSEGGYGFCVDVLRPRSSFISGIGSESPGAVKMLDMWDTQSDVITAGSGKKSKNKKAKSGIRKGAMMVTMSVHSPDIEEFITAKQTPGRLTKFNMSVLVTDKFMDAVLAHKPWNLEFPDFDSNETIVLKEISNVDSKGNPIGTATVKEIYKLTWDGNLEKWKAAGYPVKIYKTYDDANELWDLITSSTYNRNEPGIMFIDRINYWNNMYYCENINASNPCAEEPLPTDGGCLLGNINLTQFVLDGKWNYPEIEKTIRAAVRFMDNINDITYLPIKSQYEAVRSKRRIGLGVMGYASALLMMKVRYGSDKALRMTDELMRFMTNKAYECSTELAVEKGAFPAYDKELYLKGNFIRTIDESVKKLIGERGMRNSHLMTIAPTGNTSSFANVVSGGLEPVFRPKYVRTKVIENWPDTVDRILSVDWEAKTFKLENTPGATYDTDSEWTWIKEGDDSLLRAVFVENGKKTVYKFDKNRGLTSESCVTDYGVQFLIDRGEYDEMADYMIDPSKLSIDEHVSTMAVFAKYIDAAISKTITIPNDYPFEDFKDVYNKIYNSGVIKGCTTYREDTMANVLSDIGKAGDNALNDAQTKILRTKAPKRPKVLECDIHHLNIAQEKWLVFIGLYGEERYPYEVFAFKRNGIQISPKVTSGKLVKVKMRTHQTRYDLVLDEITIEDVCKHFKSGEESALTRMISTALRHGADMDYIYDQLMKAEGSIVSFSKAIARSIKKYVKTLHDTTCPECGTENALIMSEGCMRCTACTYSRCS